MKSDNFNKLEKVTFPYDEDPLDVYMNSVEKELKQLRQPKMELTFEGSSHPRSKNFILISGQIKKDCDVTKKTMDKGEIMEQNQDGLEYSDEEFADFDNHHEVRCHGNTKPKELPFVNW